MLNFGTIGSGWITDEYIYGAKDSGLWNLSAVYSRHATRGQEYAAKHGAGRFFTEVEEFAACEEIDAVYVASPNALHYSQCKLLLEHGKHVICEKPLCAQAEKIHELVTLAAANSVIFMEAIMFLHQPQLKVLEHALQNIGALSMVKLDFCQRSSKLDGYLRGELPNIFNPKLETGALMDLGIYCVYPALYLFGKPESFQINTNRMNSGADGNGVVIMQYPDKLVTLTYSKLGQAGAGSDFQGTEGTVAVESISRLGGIRLFGRNGTVEELHGDDEKFKLMGWEAKDFYRYITQPKESKDEYAKCTELSIAVGEFMEELRHKAGIYFTNDQKK